MGVIAEGILRGCQGLFTPVSLAYPLSVFNKKTLLSGVRTRGGGVAHQGHFQLVPAGMVVTLKGWREVVCQARIYMSNRIKGYEWTMFMHSAPSSIQSRLVCLF